MSVEASIELLHLVVIQSLMLVSPMLLTTMALIHQKETEFPGERVKLYKLAVDVLLRRWQRQDRRLYPP